MAWARMAEHTFHFLATDIQGTERLGAALAKVLPDGTTVCLTGTLGAGKTRLVQAIASACGVNRCDVVSPTFVLCQHYSAARKFNHLDAYRINDDDEFLELGVDEMYASDGITFVEWGELVKDCLPEDRVEIRVEVIGETGRRFHVTSLGEVAPHLCQQLEDLLAD
ncbi:MAG: tRNA (adenosine(37)-N6)-threonylcarbamoyltransferase complex ATPase subunit type 1 TsaE [Planctomycetaceae bacterium]|nr:tRNA (adenosine(37)-N6)-threonylcarbamoyltransferase complex ATPase subunit type 1 TsaE [Planctomycetales bacterium]MCB9923710.1 tRNA (adenosine(37)-N6)-threonylcarbamoyltransferase complex ATPase subunit type 1 TsaE [Planctomycetaceae bacterium]